MFLQPCAGGRAAKPKAMADGLFSVVRDFLRHRCGAARPGSLHVLPTHCTSPRFPWGLGHRRSRHSSIGVVPVSQGQSVLTHLLCAISAVVACDDREAVSCSPTAWLCARGRCTSCR